MKSFIRNVNENISLKHIIKFSNKNQLTDTILKELIKLLHRLSLKIKIRRQLKNQFHISRKRRFN